MMKPKPQVLITANMSLCMEAVEELRNVAAVDYLESAERSEVLVGIEKADAYICSTDRRIDRELLDRAPRLKIVCTCSTGTDHIDIPELDRRGIALHSIKREYELLDSFTSVAEMTWGLLIACNRRIPMQFERAKRGELRWWTAPGPVPRQLSGKTLGVLGVGRLGSMLVEYGKAFRMRVLGCDTRTRDIPGLEQVEFDRLIRESDVLSVMIHLTDETHHIISRDVIACMKPGAILLNTARGDLVDEDALIDALESGHLFAAGLDVFHNEWDPDLASHRLLEYARTHDNLIVTPHLAGASYESIIGARVFMAKKLAGILSSK